MTNRERRPKPLFVLALPAVLALSLGACAGDANMGELRDFVERAINRPPGPIEPLPEFVSYEPFTYSAASLRSPFEPPADLSEAMREPPDNQVQPDENRPREELEDFSLANLSMVGSLAREGRTWALIRDSEGVVHRVGVGNYLGRNHGRVVAITPQQVQLVEIVPSGDGGWVERPQTLVQVGLEGAGGARQ